MKRVLVTSIITLAGCLSSMAVPAKPGLLTMTEADGSVVKVRLVGDERHHFYLSEDGYLLANDKDIFYYANTDETGKILKSEYRLTAPDKRSAALNNYLRKVDMPRVYEKLSEAAEAAPRRSARGVAKSESDTPHEFGIGLFPGTPYPSYGDQKAIVILVEYTDVKFNLNDPHDYFNRMLNEEGFSDYGGTGSATDFFVENSMGQFMPEFDLYGPITLSQKMSYYGGNDWSGNDQHPEQMVIEACQQLDDMVDFSEYDRDGDGYIDNVFVFYAGRGEASGGSRDTVWPHSWNVTSATSTPYVFDGVRLDRYACSNEWEGSRPDGIGTFVHEFSHVMGLPDLYATSYSSAFTPGSWSAMDYGPYNNGGCTPPNYGAFERYALGWATPLEMTEPANATLYPVASNQVGIIRSGKENEFFLVENRQKTGWDTYIPGHGMLVWHVDYNESVWNRNVVNDTPSHQYVDIVEADGTQSEGSRAGDAFPGTANVTSFTDDTRPAMKTWGGVGLDTPLENIAEKDGVITFTIKGGAEDFEGTASLDPLDVTFESFVAAWEPVDGATYLLSVYTYDSETGEKEDGLGRKYLSGLQNKSISDATSYFVGGLEPEHYYYYEVRVGTGWQASVPSEEVEVFTGKLPLERRKMTAFDPEEIGEDYFVALWNQEEDATDYLITVYVKEPTGTFEAVNDFAGGGTLLPGWESSSKLSYAMASYAGEAIPSLRLGKSGDYIISPDFDDEVKGFSFWHRGNGTGAGDLINIWVKKNGKWTKLDVLDVVKDKGGFIATYNDIDEDVVAVKIEYVNNSGKGSLAVDDFTINHGVKYEPRVLEAYDTLATGDTYTYRVDGLETDTDYYYVVKATDGEKISHASNEVKVALRKENGIDSTVADGIESSLDGRRLSINGLAGGDVVTVADVAGKVVGRVSADQSGHVSLELPSAGIYIVNVDGKASIKTVCK